MTKKTRPSSLDEMRARVAPLFAGEKMKTGLQLQLRPSDVVITPYSKSGTTWTQQIVHTLRTGGDMDFDDISRVVPWIEVSPILGLPLDGEQRANPRAFKSHLPWNLVPKGGRYINVVRDPGDVVVSLLRFQEGWFLEPGSVSLDEYVREEFLVQRNYYHHLVSWWPRRNDEDVLFMAYENMLADSELSIRRIAKFIEIELDDALLEQVKHYSSVEFMLAHKDRFDDAMLRKLSEDMADLPEGSDSAKVRIGKSGAGREISPAVKQQMDEVWHEEVTEKLGFENYSALVAALE